jgi:5-methyltetrahydrofolate--homocysteine methyltransferase
MSADDPKRVECVLGFPRQPGKQRLCLADYFQGTESDTTDVIAFQVVTVGARSAVVSEALNSEGHYSKSLYLHGLAVQAAEALAEYNTRRIRAELGISPKSGLRYSYGYPACPDMEEQKKLFRLLEPEKTIGVELTEGYQMTPEASTNAIFVPHPDAKYYTV